MIEEETARAGGRIRARPLRNLWVISPFMSGAYALISATNARVALVPWLLMRFDHIFRARSLHHKLTSHYQPPSSLLRALLECNATDQPLVCSARMRLVNAGDRDKSINTVDRILPITINWWRKRVDDDYWLINWLTQACMRLLEILDVIHRFWNVKEK